MTDATPKATAGPSGGDPHADLKSQITSYCGQQLDPFKAAERATELIGGLRSAGCSDQDLYTQVCRRVAEYRLRDHAYSLLVNAWDALGEIQRKSGEMHKRGKIAGHLWGLARDQGTRLRWTLLAYFDDLRWDLKSGAAKDLLSTVFGAGSAEFQEFDAIAGACKAQRGTDWSSCPGFAEYAFLRAASSEELAALVEASATEVDFPLSPPFFAALLEHADKKGLTKQEKGDALEELARYVAFLIPGCTVVPNVLDVDEVGESDLLVANRGVKPNLFSELLGRHFIVECKNWDTVTVGVQQVGYFILRIQLTHCRFGIMLAKNGITGDSDGKSAARGLIRRAYHENGTLCVVLDKHDLGRLKDGTLSASSLLIQKMEEFRFGRRKQAKKNNSG